MDALERRKDRELDRLASAYAQDRISLEEFERLTDLVNGARSDGEIDAAVRDLVPSSGFGTAAGASPWSSDDAGVPGEPSDTIFTMMGQTSRRGNWIRRRETTAITIMGSTKLDLRECEIPPNATISVVTVMGEVEIIIPPDVSIRQEVSTIMAEANDRAGDGPPGGRQIRLSGLVLMGELRIRRKA